MIYKSEPGKRKKVMRLQRNERKRFALQRISWLIRVSRGKGKKVMRSVKKESLCGDERMKNTEGKERTSYQLIL